MRSTLNAERLRYEMSIRGLKYRDFARRAGLSQPTLAQALKGRPVEQRSLEKLAGALARIPADPVLRDLIAPPDAAPAIGS